MGRTRRHDASRREKANGNVHQEESYRLGVKGQTGHSCLGGRAFWPCSEIHRGGLLHVGRFEHIKPSEHVEHAEHASARRSASRQQYPGCDEFTLRCWRLCPSRWFDSNSMHKCKFQ